MIKIYILYICMLVATCASAQNDSIQVQQAKDALLVAKNCDAALGYLGKVSERGKAGADYLLYMGSANDCKLNSEQALYYYEKYLELQPASNSVKKRVAELNDQKAQKARVAEQINAAKASYKAGSSRHTKRSKRKSINDNFVMISAAYGVGLGGNNAPYKSAVNINYSVSYPIIHNRVTLGYDYNSGFLLSPNKPWFSRVFAVPVGAVSDVGLGISESISFVPMAVIVNTHKVALTAGPEIGVGMMYTPEVGESYGGAINFNDGVDFGLSYGVRSNLLLGSGLAFYAAYTTFSVKTVSTEYGGVSQSYGISHARLSIGISYRINYDDLRGNWWW